MTIDPKVFNRTNPGHGLFVSFPSKSIKSMVKKHPENLTCWTREKKGFQRKIGQKHAKTTISSILWWLEARRPQVCCRLGLVVALPSVWPAWLQTNSWRTTQASHVSMFFESTQHQDPHVGDLAVTQFSDMLNLLNQIIRWHDDESLLGSCPSFSGL